MNCFPEGVDPYSEILDLEKHLEIEVYLSPEQRLLVAYLPTQPPST
jgi:hypothetical protein